MDRLETGYYSTYIIVFVIFIFQYGQIRNIVRSCTVFTIYRDLYSSMDRLETFKYNKDTKQIELFIFQYGQIRNLPFNPSKPKLRKYLYSSMDRLETLQTSASDASSAQFIFQYGQIRNRGRASTFISIKSIYIPVWIDQKQPCYIA